MYFLSLRPDQLLALAGITWIVGLIFSCPCAALAANKSSYLAPSTSTNAGVTLPSARVTPCSLTYPAPRPLSERLKRKWPCGSRSGTFPGFPAIIEGLDHFGLQLL